MKCQKQQIVLCAESADNQFVLSGVMVDKKQNADVKIMDNSQYVLSVSIPVNYFVPSDKLYFFDKPKTERKYLLFPICHKIKSRLSKE